MVGKPNLPADAEKRGDVHGAARSTPGLSALDEEREASMADEGGSSGAAIEGQEDDERDALDDELDEVSLGYDALIVGGIFAAGALAGLVIGLLLNRR